MDRNPRKCILDPNHWCDNCGECDRCDLNPDKICDNCMKCMSIANADYLAIEVDEILMDDTDL